MCSSVSNVYNIIKEFNFYKKGKVYMANIVTLKNNTTNEINYPRTVKSALLNDDGTPM